MSAIPAPQAPVVTQDSGPMGGTIQEHPAFAQIQANRVSGGATLYGSDFQHQHYVTIRISKSTLRRSLSNDWPHASLLPYIEVNLSEAQWANFVSSMNVGTGVQCTLTYLNGERMPDIAEPENRREQFAFESDERIQSALHRLEELSTAICALKISSKTMDQMLRHVQHAKSSLVSNQKFVAEMFAEHMEKTVVHAKQEIDGYVAGALRQAGLQALADGGMKVKLLGHGDAS